MSHLAMHHMVKEEKMATAVIRLKSFPLVLLLDLLVYISVVKWKKALLPVHREMESRVGRSLIQAIYKETGFDPDKL